MNPSLGGRGYHNLPALWSDPQQDFYSYAVREATDLRECTQEDKDVFFVPDFRRRGCFPVPPKIQARVTESGEFGLRPHRYGIKPGKKSDTLCWMTRKAGRGETTEITRLWWEARRLGYPPNAKYSTSRTNTPPTSTRGMLELICCSPRTNFRSSSAATPANIIRIGKNWTA